MILLKIIFIYLFILNRLLNQKLKRDDEIKEFCQLRQANTNCSWSLKQILSLPVCFNNIICLISFIIIIIAISL